MNFYAVGFVAVLGVVGLGVDYHQQSVNAGVPLGVLGPGDYIETITARFDAHKAEKLAEEVEAERKRAWKVGGKPYLPEAPAGWTRRGFDEGPTTAIVPAYKQARGSGMASRANYLSQARMEDAVSGGASSAAEGVSNMMGQRSAADIAKAVATRSWVYERGDETIFVEVTQRKKPNLNSLVGNISKMMEATMGAMDGIDRGWDVIGGVAFFESLNADGTRPNHYRILTATIGFGQEIDLRVHANASSASTREVLSAIDFDGLNAMLKNPMSSVGNEMTPPPGIDRVELAERMAKVRREFDALIMMEGQYRLQNLNAGALMINTMAQGYGVGGGGLVDITGGQAVNMETLIYAGYRQAMREVMEGGDGRQAAGEVGGFLKQAMVDNPGADPAKPKELPKGVMSAALAAELGVMQAAEAAPAAATAAALAAAATAPVNMSGYNPEKLTKAERSFVERFADAGHKGDGPDQEAARVMEYQRGLPPGSCLMNHKINKVLCGRSAEKVRAAFGTRTAAADAPARKGGLMGSIAGLWGGGSKEAANAKEARKKVQIRQLGKSGGGARIVQGGCGAGQFCEVKEGD